MTQIASQAETIFTNVFTLLCVFFTEIILSEEKFVLSNKIFIFVEVLSFAKVNTVVIIVSAMTQDSNSDSGESVNLIEKSDFILTGYIIKRSAS